MNRRRQKHQAVAQRSTRNKIRFQAVSAYADLKRAENHLAQLAALADDRSKYIDNNLPEIMAALKFVTEAVDKFSEGL